MPGWKCKIGYVNSVQNLSLQSCIFTDDGTWYLPEFPDNITKSNYSDINKLASDLEIYLGDSYYNSYAYAFYNGMTDEDLNIYKQLMPGVIKMAPNLINYLKSNTVIYFVCYIPALKRAIGKYPTGAAHGYIVAEDGKFSEIGDNMENQFSIVSHLSGSGGRIINIYGLRSGYSDIKDPTQYCRLGIVWKNNDKGWFIRNNSTYEGMEAYKSFWLDYSPPDITDNPYSPGGSSSSGGGGGSFNNNSDTITIPSKPTLSSSNTGFTRIYNPTLSQVRDLAQYLWTDESVIQTIWNHIKQYFENPMDAMIGFNLVPVQVPNGGSESFKLMYIDTGVTMNTAANQFVDVDCGSLEIQEYYGSALDYSPYTKISCFLPFIGNVSLNVDEVMKKTISITYRVDICSGACVAYISVDGNAIYQFSGHCAIPIPFSSADFSSYVNAIISTAKLATSALVAGASAMGATAVADAAQQTNQVVTTTQVTQTARNPATGRQITTGTTTTVETRESPKDQSSTQASFSGLTPQNVANTVGAIMSSKPHIEHSGSFSGNSGYLGIRRPFVIIERPNMCMPENYQQLNGFPCMITLPLSDCTGFTRVQQVQLTGVKATNPEQAELLELLKSGVIL